MLYLNVKKRLPNFGDITTFILVICSISLWLWRCCPRSLPYTTGNLIAMTFGTLHFALHALCPVLRMFAVLIISLAVTFMYATWTANNNRAKDVMVPPLEVLQSMLILGFLSITYKAVTWYGFLSDAMAPKTIIMITILEN